MYKMLEETPVNHCFAVKCDKCGKTTWRVGVRSFIRCVNHSSISGRDAVPTLNP